MDGFYYQLISKCFEHLMTYFLLQIGEKNNFTSAQPSQLNKLD
jgi:hypothetical protein